jgi:Uma2 family endonuclease
MSIAEATSLILGLEHNGICMSTEEFDAITEYDDNYRYELIHGVLVVNPIPLPQERGPNQELGRQLLNYQEGHPKGKSLDDTLEEEYVGTETGRRRADRVIWTGLGRQPNLELDVPTIVVEFVFAGRRSWKRDYIEKRDEYVALGVIEYWVINRFERQMTVFRKKRKGGFTEQVVAEREAYRCDLLPGFELDLARLIAVADRWEDSRQ